MLQTPRLRSNTSNIIDLTSDDDDGDDMVTAFDETALRYYGAT